eukprot:TRINITY_DN5807_c0_g1_i4.p1 TRINITY_DN5807_c0_g1~~TRINITY_DN5807_c0_g1_i4.p1  ORF type:complete len:595 (+),score=127.89 TRINITY_DN5807_c0_g1_i4:621-2405(+)
MSEASLRILFQPFTQSEMSTSRRFGGTGLGLVISKQIVEMMGGIISVTSKEGAGTTFTFTVKLSLPPFGVDAVACNDLGAPVPLPSDLDSSPDMFAFAPTLSSTHTPLHPEVSYDDRVRISSSLFVYVLGLRSYAVTRSVTQYLADCHARFTIIPPTIRIPSHRTARAHTLDKYYAHLPSVAPPPHNHDNAVVIADLSEHMEMHTRGRGGHTPTCTVGCSVRSCVLNTVQQDSALARAHWLFLIPAKLLPQTSLIRRALSAARPSGRVLFCPINPIKRNMLWANLLECATHPPRPSGPSIGPHIHLAHANQDPGAYAREHEQTPTPHRRAGSPLLTLPRTPSLSPLKDSSGLPPPSSLSSSSSSSSSSLLSEELLTYESAALVPAPTPTPAPAPAPPPSSALAYRPHAIDRQLLEGIQALPRMRILSVEDNLLNQHILVRQLQKLGLTTDTANNGEEALTLVRRAGPPGSDPGPYDVILMDCQMPVMDGYACTEEIRALEAARAGLYPPHETTVIALTASAMPSEQQHCQDSGMNFYLSKPLELKALARMLLMVGLRRAAKNEKGNEGERKRKSDTTKEDHTKKARTDEAENHV